MKLTAENLMAATQRPQPRITTWEKEIVCQVTDISGPGKLICKWQVERPTIYKAIYANASGRKISIASFKIGEHEQFNGVLPLGALCVDEHTSPEDCPCFLLMTLTPNVAATIELTFDALEGPFGDLPRLPHGLYFEMVNGRRRTVKASDEPGLLRIILEGFATA
jgi:hypothetical protein